MATQSYGMAPMQPPQAPAGQQWPQPQDVDPTLLANYFAVEPKWKFPWKTIWWFVVACVFLIVTLSLFANQSVGAGIICLLLAAYCAAYGAARIYWTRRPLVQYRNRATLTDAQYQYWLTLQDNTVVDRGCRRLNIDRSEIPNRVQVVADEKMVRSGLANEGAYFPAARNPRIRTWVWRWLRTKLHIGRPPLPPRLFLISNRHQDDQGTLQLRVQQYTLYFARHDSLALYTSVKDATNQNFTADTTTEIPYEHIASVDTVQGSIDIPGDAAIPQPYRFTAERLVIHNVSGAETSTPLVPQLHPGVEDSQIEDTVNSLREVLRNWRQRNRPQQLGGYTSGGYPSMGGAPGYPSIGAPGYPPTGAFPPTGYPTPAPQGYGPVVSAAVPQTPPAGFAPPPAAPVPPVAQAVSAYDPSPPPIYTPMPQGDDSPTTPMTPMTPDTADTVDTSDMPDTPSANA
ncbi:MAG: hypothetical protein ACHQ1E_01510 [Ktedonobacterales bacterium]